MRVGHARAEQTLLVQAAAADLVYAGEDVYQGWTRSGSELTISTAALSRDLLKIRVVEGQ